jgi:hypothetical protein
MQSRSTLEVGLAIVGAKESYNVGDFASVSPRGQLRTSELLTRIWWKGTAEMLVECNVLQLKLACDIISHVAVSRLQATIVWARVLVTSYGRIFAVKVQFIHGNCINHTLIRSVSLWFTSCPYMRESSSRAYVDPKSGYKRVSISVN